MGRRRVLRIGVFLGLLVLIESSPMSRDSHPHSMAQMLSNLFIEPQTVRSYRSTSGVREEQSNEANAVKEKETTPMGSHPSLHQPKQSLHPTEGNPMPNSPNNQNPGPFPGTTVLRFEPKPIMPLTGQPRPNFKQPPPRPSVFPGPPRPILNFRPPMFNPNVRPPVNAPFQSLPQQGPLRTPFDPSLNIPPSDGQSPSNRPPPNPQVGTENLPHNQDNNENGSQRKSILDLKGNGSPMSTSEMNPSEEKNMSLPPNRPAQTESAVPPNRPGQTESAVPPNRPGQTESAVPPNRQDQIDSAFPPNNPVRTESLPTPFNPSVLPGPMIPHREAQFFSNRPRLQPPYPQTSFPPFYGRAPQPPRPLNVPSSLNTVEDFLLPPNIVRREQCVGVNGTMIGECSDPFSCEESGGKSVGSCPNKAGSPQACCSFVSFCNFMTNVERAYLSSPNYPEPVTNIESCAFQLSPLEDVCQVRIDFLDFHMKAPVNGVCDDENALYVESNDPNAFIPVKKICGTLSEDDWDPLGEDVPHIYIHFKSMGDGNPISSDKSPPKRLRYPNKPENLLAFKIKVRDAKSSWNLRINQISCEGGARQEAPFGCAQYFTGESGRIKSLNHRDGNYPSNLDITSCIKSDPEACGINYTFEGGTSMDEEVGEGLSFGKDCGGDFLLFSGQKAGICGTLNTNTSFAFENNRGPQSLHFHSNSRFSPSKDKGYSLSYEHLYNCREVNYFNYNHIGI